MFMWGTTLKHKHICLKCIYVSTTGTKCIYDPMDNKYVLPFVY